MFLFINLIILQFDCMGMSLTELVNQTVLQAKKADCSSPQSLESLEKIVCNKNNGE
jgi:hypothetical protein